MAQNIDLHQEFENWLLENCEDTSRKDRLAQTLRNMVHNPTVTSTQRLETMQAWLQRAYLAGARRMAQDSLDTLGDYGTAVAGCETPVRNPTECYDAARENLMVYYTQVLDKAKA